MYEWTSGLRFAYCVDAPLPDLVSPFRRALAKVVTKYCKNTTACNIRTPLVFYNCEVQTFVGVITNLG